MLTIYVCTWSRKCVKHIVYAACIDTYLQRHTSFSMDAMCARVFDHEKHIIFTTAWLHVHLCMCVMVVGFEPKSKLVCSTHTLVCLVLTYKSAMFCASRSQRDSIHLLLKLSIEIPCDPIEFLLTVLLVLVHMHGRMDCKVHKLKHPSLLYKACKQNVYILQSARSMVYTYYSRDNKRPAQDHFW